MALIRAERVMENSTTTGTGSLTLSGPVSGFRSFASVMSTSDTCYYAVQEVTDAGKPSGQWEVGLGTLTASTTLARTTILSSSNSNNAVNFASGTKQVYIAFTAYELASINSDIAARANPIIVDVYTSNNTWTKPTGAKLHDIIVVGGGKGGDSGGLATSSVLGSVDATGGNGSKPGELNARYRVATEALTSTVSVTVGAGGAGGAARTTVGTGNTGANGGNSSFGSYVSANGATAQYSFGTGGSVTDAVATSGTTGHAGFSGGFSLSVNSSQTVSSGILTIDPTTAGTLGAGASTTNATATATAGGAGTTLSGASAGQVSSGGGGGGGAGVTTAGASTPAIGGDGGNGGFPGGGGGGGGAAGTQRSTLPTGSRSGKGGDGGSGAVIVITYF